MAALDFSSRGAPANPPDPRIRPVNATAPVDEADDAPLDFSARATPAPDFSARGAKMPEGRGALGGIGVMEPIESIRAAGEDLAAAEAERRAAEEEAAAVPGGLPLGLGADQERIASSDLGAERPVWMQSGDEAARSRAALRLRKATIDAMTARNRVLGIEAKPELTSGRAAADSFVDAFLSVPVDVLKATGVAAGALPGAVENNVIVEVADDAKAWLERQFPGDQARQGEFFNQLASGGGSFAGFIVGGMVGKGIGAAMGGGGRATQIGTTAGLGAATGGVGGYEEAMQMGATAAQRYASFFANAGIGLSEAIPIDRMFYRLNRASGGKFMHVLENTTAQSFEEFLQEAGQQIGQDAIAKFVAGYDPERELGAEDAIAAGSVGAILGALGGGAAGIATKPGTIRGSEEARFGNPLGRPSPETPEGLPEGAVPADTLYPAPPEEQAAPPAAPPAAEAPAPVLPTAEPEITQAAPAEPAPQGLPAAVEEVVAPAVTDVAPEPPPVAPQKATPASPPPAVAEPPDEPEVVAPATEAMQKRRAELEAAGVTGPALDKLAAIEPAAETAASGKGEDVADAPMSDWQRQNRQAAVDLAERLKVTDTIRQMAEAGKTAKEISQAIEGRLDDNEVRAVRDHLGIKPAGPMGGLLMGGKVEGDGHRTAPVDLTAGGTIEQATARPKQEATDARVIAGNAELDHVKWRNYGIGIETRKGEERRSRADSPTRWVVPKMPIAYGKFKGIKGADGDDLDVNVGEQPQVTSVFVLDQVDADTGAFDEHKVFIQVPTEQVVRSVYARSFSDNRGKDRIGAVTKMTPEQFDAWAPTAAEGRPVGTIAPRQAGPVKTAPGPVKSTAEPGTSGPRVMVNLVGRDGKTDAERGGPLPPEGDQFAADREAAKGFKKGDMVAFKLPTGKEAIGFVDRVSAKEQGTFDVRDQRGGVWNVRASRMTKKVPEALPAAEPVEHPGLIIQSLETGKRTVIQPKGTVPPKPKAAKPEKPKTAAEQRSEKRTLVGKNAKGQEVFEDENGIRSIMEGNIQLTEPVELQPTRDGYVARPRAKRPAEYEVVEEKPAEPPADAGEVTDETLAEVKSPGTIKITAEDLRPGDYWNGIRGENVVVQSTEIVRGRLQAQTSQGLKEFDTDAVLYVTRPAAPRVEAPARPAGFGAKNKLVTVSDMDDLRAQLRAKLKSQVSSGLDPEFMTIGMRMTVFYIEGGVRKLADIIVMLAEDAGVEVDKLRPYMRTWYEAARTFMEDAGEDTAGMDTPDEARAAIKALAQGAGDVDQGRRPEDQGGERRPGGDVAAGEPGGPGAGPEVAPGPAEDGGEARGAGDTGGVRAPLGPPLPRDGSEVSGGRDGADRRAGAGGGGAPVAGAGERGLPGRDDSQPAATRPNYFIADPEALIGGGPKVRFARNKAAILAYQEIRDEGRDPTQSDLDALASYIGWGSFGQELFQGSWEKPRPKSGWEAEDAWLREHLGQNEWESAQRSIINAHYTDPPTVQTMWAMVERMGFKGGRVLEPSLGIGNFFGLMPRALMDKSDLTGIELDALTGGMAKILYPHANIQIKGYQESKTQDDFYDLVIGNWPFANVAPADRRYDALNPSLHDYFFVKALDQVRPGGLVVGITSAFTMDKAGKSVRIALAKKAELVASFRLPSGSFEKYAGTGVVTDIIVLRKREAALTTIDGSQGYVDWVETLDTPTPAGEKVRVNSYYVGLPQNILGRLNWGHGTTSGRPGMIVERQADFAEQLASLPSRLPDDVYRPFTRAKNIRYVPNNSADRHGSIVAQDGKLYQVAGERMALLEDVVKYKVKSDTETKRREDQVAELVDIRRAYGRLIDAERDGLANTETLRRDLRILVDGFRSSYGPITKSDGLRIVEKAGDPAAPILAALERPDGTPSLILTEATTRAKRRLTNPTVRDAYVMLRNETTILDIDRIAEMAGVTPEAAAAELIKSGAIYRTPGGGIEAADVYLSGNVRRKLREALEAQARGEDLAGTIEALRGVIPSDTPYFQIEAKLGATWVSDERYKDFVGHLLGVSDTAGMEVRFAASAWKVRLNDSLNTRARSSTNWGHDDVRFDRLLRSAMNNQTITIRRRDSDGNQYIDEQASAEANEKIRLIREEFSAWAWADPERRIVFERAYNEVFRAIADPRFDGSFLEFAGMALRRGEEPFNLRRHQVNAIWRGVANKRGIYAHEVGTGKAQPLDAKVLTPTGWTTMGALKVGDAVIAGDGSITRVVGVFPQGEKDIFRVTMSDGSSTECCDDHLWLTQTYKARNYAQRARMAGKDWPCGAATVKPLSEIRRTLVSEHLGARNHSIPVVGAVAMVERPVPIDPYLLGVLVGDGCLRQAVTFSTADAEIVDRVAAVLPANCEVHHRSGYDYAIAYTGSMAKVVGAEDRRVHPVKTPLIQLGLWGKLAHEKRIPRAYIDNAAGVRLAVLRGLMDTDGTVDAKGTSTSFCTTSPGLADDVTELVRSLGGVARRTVKRVAGNRDAMTLTIAMPPSVNPFSLARKAERVRPKSKYAPARYIETVKPAGRKEARCIAVDHPSRLYVTDDHIVTHNTYTIAGIAVESRRYGVAKKPLVLAHNANSAQVAAGIREMYPGAAVLYIDNLAPDQVQTRLRQIRNEDWDAVVLPHSLIDNLTLKRETLESLMADQIAQLEDEAIQAASDDGANLTVEMMDDAEAMKRVRSATAKDLVRARERIKAKIEKMAQRSSKPDAIAFEDLGIDMILVDEAHEFKKPPIATRMKMRGLNTATSGRSVTLQFITGYIKKQNNGNGVHLFTGTPITNTLTEIFKHQRFVMDDVMALDGIEEWDAWFNTFADSTNDVELGATGEYEPVTRLAAFVNVAELRRMIGQYLDIVFADDMPEFRPRETSTGKTLNDPLDEGERREIESGRTEKPEGRPYKRIINDVAPLGPQQENILRRLQEDARRFRNGTRKQRFDWQRAGADESPIIIEGRATKASLDVRLFDPEAEDHPQSKANRLVRNVLDIYGQSREATQVIFMENGYSDEAVSRRVNPSDPTGPKIVRRTARLNLAKDIVAKLVAGGIPEKEIAIVAGGVSAEKKKAIADAMNRSEIRVVIGRTDTLGTGVNMQENLRAMHHMDAPWMPGELEQRNGRGWRQGNKWNTVLEVRYITEGLDGRRWQVLGVKDRFIKSFLKADDTIRVIEGDAVSEQEGVDAMGIAETLSEAAGDPRLLIINKLKADVVRLERRERLYSFGIADAADKIKAQQRVIADAKEKLVDYEAAAATWEIEKNEPIRATIDGKVYDGAKDKAAREKIGEALTRTLQGFAKGEKREIGSFRNMPLRGDWSRPLQDEPEFFLTAGDREFRVKASVASIEATARNFATNAANERARIEQADQAITRLEEAMRQPFQQGPVLVRKRDQLAELEADIQAHPSPPPMWLRVGAPVDTEVYVDGVRHVVIGHRWTERDWEVTTEEGAFSYRDVKDGQGMNLFEAREFEAPVQRRPDQPAAAPDTATALSALPRGEAPAGLPLFSAAPRGPARPRLSPRELKDIETAIRAEVKRIAGGDVSVWTFDKISVDQFRTSAQRDYANFAGAAGGRARLSETAGGVATVQSTGEALVRVALQDPAFPNPWQTAWHEAYHVVEMRSMDEETFAEVNAPENMAIAVEMAARATGVSPSIIEALPGYEIRAMAFEQYVATREAGLDPQPASSALLQWFRKLLDMIEAVRDQLFRRGIRTIDQIFEDVYQGRYAFAGERIRAPGQGLSAVPRGGVNSEAFKKWFGKSKVVNKDGSPKVVYHGTNANFGVFERTDDIGFHFGTAAQANARIDFAFGRGADDVNIMPVYLRIENPVELPDMNDWSPAEVKMSFEEWGIITAEQADSTDIVDREQVRDWLAARGYDGVVYRNRGEDQTSSEDSYIVFDPEQIKSVANRGTFDPGNPSILLSAIPRGGDPFSPNQNEGRQREVNRRLNLGQPIDRVIRIPFQIFGGVDQYGQWKPGLRLWQKGQSPLTGTALGFGIGMSAGGPVGAVAGAAIGGAAGALIRARFTTSGRFGFLNPILENVRRGILDRHGLDPEYIDRDRARNLEERRRLRQVPEMMALLANKSVGPQEARALQAMLTGETITPAEWADIAEPIREAIDAQGQEMVDLGLISAESYERNRGVYLHRSYLKHEAEAGSLGAMMAKMRASYRKKMIGKEFKGRGLWMTVKLQGLFPDVEEPTRPANGEKFRVLDRVEMDDGTNDTLQAKVLERRYLPADAAVPDDLADWQDRGIFEVRGWERGKVVLWRDWTKPERERMGEILDVRYNIAKTWMLASHDIATGRFYKDIAENESWATNDEPPAGTWKDGGDYGLFGGRYWSDPSIEWVRVPETIIAKSRTKRYGALAGMFVRAEIWRDINETELTQKQTWFRSLMSFWKVSKTALSPVVHMNNVMSNVMFMDLADVTATDLVRGIQSLINKDQAYQEAEANGAFGADVISQEIRNQTLRPILDELLRENVPEEGRNLDRVTRAAGILGRGLFRSGKWAYRKMIDTYQLEDEVFRMALYHRRRKQGADPVTAATEAREQFIDYDIKAPWVNAARRSVLPFLAYTYRAIPLVARAIATRPWKLVKYFALAQAMNAFSYAMFPGDEDEERRAMPEELQGVTWIGAPRMLRLPWGDGHGNPVFLDIRRWIPAGDVYDLTQGHSALPLLAWLQPGGPIAIGAELFLNRQAFTGQPIVNELTDDWWDRTQKLADYGWTSFMPSAAWIPGSWYWQKIGRALRGARDFGGEPYDVGDAMLQSVGIKVRPLDVQEEFRIKALEFNRVERELKFQMGALGRQRARRLITQAEYLKARYKIIDKFRSLNDKRKEVFTGRGR